LTNEEIERLIDYIADPTKAYLEFSLDESNTIIEALEAYKEINN